MPDRIARLRMRLSEERSQCRVGFFDQALGGRPVDTAIGNGNPVLQVFDGLRERLVAGMEVTLDHCADDAEVGHALADDFAEDIGLFGWILVTVGVTAVRHNRGLETGRFKFFTSGGDIFYTEVGALVATAQDDVAGRVATGASEPVAG